MSRRIREEFHNGKEYYAMHGNGIRLPQNSNQLPSREYLACTTKAGFALSYILQRFAVLVLGFLPLVFFAALDERLR